LRHFRALPLLAVLAATQVSAAVPLDGWGAYKFGMSPDAARAIPGNSFKAYAAKNLWNENKGAMGATTHPRINGVTYDLNLYFDGVTSKLNGIGLENQKKNVTLTECGLSFLALLSQQEKNYGGFAPVSPERKRSTTDPLPTSVEWKQEGASRYELATVTLADEYAYAWKARKSAGGNYVEIRATWSAHPDTKTAACLTAIQYAGK
jgi:hypothetical protein